MKGALVKRGNSWRLIVDVGTDPITGKRRQRTRTLPPVDGKALGKRDAQEALREFIGEVVTERRTDHSQAPLRELFNAYLDVLRARGKSPGTIAEADRRFRSYVPDHLARTAIGKIHTFTLDQLYTHLIAQGGLCRKRIDKCDRVPCDHGAGSPLAPATVDRLHTDLNAAFAQAVRWGWLRANPATNAVNLESDPSEVEPPDVADVVRFLAHVETLPEDVTLRDFVPLIVETGARPAELCAAKVGDVDFERGILTIRRSFSRGDGGTVKDTKTHKARRVRISPALLARLMERRQRLAVDALAAGLPLDGWWWFPAPSDPMRPVWPSSVSRELRQERDRLGIGPELTLRNVRHWVASVLLAEGVDVRTTAGRLGHGPNVTLGVYGHILDSADQAAVNVVPMVLERERRRADRR